MGQSSHLFHCLVLSLLVSFFTSHFPYAWWIHQTFLRLSRLLLLDLGLFSPVVDESRARFLCHIEQQTGWQKRPALWKYRPPGVISVRFFRRYRTIDSACANSWRGRRPFNRLHPRTSPRVSARPFRPFEDSSNKKKKRMANGIDLYFIANLVYRWFDSSSPFYLFNLLFFPLSLRILRSKKKNKDQRS